MFWSSERKPICRKRGNRWKQLYTMNWTTTNAETVSQRCSVKEVFLEISQNSQENTCVRVSFLVKSLRPATLLKKSLWYRCFPVNFPKFLSAYFLQNTSGRLLLKLQNTYELMNLWISDEKNSLHRTFIPSHRLKILPCQLLSLLLLQHRRKQDIFPFGWWPSRTSFFITA